MTLQVDQQLIDDVIAELEDRYENEHTAVENVGHVLNAFGVGIVLVYAFDNKYWIMVDDVSVNYAARLVTFTGDITRAGVANIVTQIARFANAIQQEYDYKLTYAKYDERAHIVNEMQYRRNIAAERTVGTYGMGWRDAMTALKSITNKPLGAP